MGKAKGQPGIVAALKALPPKRRTCAIDKLPEAVRKECEEVAEGYRSGELEGVAVTDAYRALRQRHGESFALSMSSWRTWVRERSGR